MPLSSEDGLPVRTPYERSRRAATCYTQPQTQLVSGNDIAQVAQLSQRDRRRYRSTFNYCNVMGRQSYRIQWNKAKYGLLCGSRLFKVADVNTCDVERSYATYYEWLIVTDILPRIVLKLLQIVVKILDTLHFRFPFGGLGSTYTIPLRLIGKQVVDFLVVLIELFSQAVTAEAIRANIE